MPLNKGLFDTLLSTLFVNLIVSFQQLLTICYQHQVINNLSTLKRCGKLWKTSCFIPIIRTCKQKNVENSVYFVFSLEICFDIVYHIDYK